MGVYGFFTFDVSKTFQDTQDTSVYWQIKSFWKFVLFPGFIEFRLPEVLVVVAYFNHVYFTDNNNVLFCLFSICFVQKQVNRPAVSALKKDFFEFLSRTVCFYLRTVFLVPNLRSSR